jgi:hypothetical protein
MNPLNLITDGYERKARLYPGLAVLLPIVVTVITIVPTKLSVLQSVGAGLAACGGLFLLAQLARDAGKKRERALFTRWGGMPSVAIFRHRDPRLDAITKARYHKKMASVVKGAKAPSPEEEQGDPAAADQVYTAWFTYVRVNTRDTKKYSLLFQENLNYGYRRNTWGLRPVGISTSALACAISAAVVAQTYWATGSTSPEIMGAGILGLVFLVLWIFRFSADWVRIPADAYAERLTEAVDTMGAKTAAANK